MTTKQQAVSALADLREAINRAQDVMEQIRLYWHEDAAMNRALAEDSDTFSKAACNVVKQVQKAVDDFEDEGHDAKGLQRPNERAAEKEARHGN